VDQMVGLHRLIWLLVGFAGFCLVEGTHSSALGLSEVELTLGLDKFFSTDALLVMLLR
jgi:hypothetical protein